ncbi:hypothetical protein SCLCIDRAFT_21207 [Scleroderma citrinum Foug A]|uniref:Uncharacterized protein n=1 Tax=Scleroderma citrinum Foug A TaxID=1036808 RepID=A0A0C3AQZ1_9AGAM|nr:hypothetical protein SCLCIDRAFT_21207 [Scleroderma citrinum Foug A]
MSSGNNTNNGSNGNGANKIDWHPNCKVQQVAEQEAQRKAEEERRKAKEGAKRVAKEEARKLAEEEAKKKAEEDAQKRAKFQVWWQANSERKARKKAEAKAAMEVMRVLIVQKAVQGEKLKPKQCWAASQRMPDKEVKRWYPPCNWCWKSGDSKKMKVKCYFEVSMATMKRLASGEKCKESEVSLTVVATLP